MNDQAGNDDSPGERRRLNGRLVASVKEERQTVPIDGVVMTSVANGVVRNSAGVVNNSGINETSENEQYKRRNRRRRIKYDCVGAKSNGSK